MSDHTHHHDHPHDDDPHAERAEALESLLVKKGLATHEEIDAIAHRYEHELGPGNGAKVVARAWMDPEFKRRLLEDAMGAIAEVGLGAQARSPLVAVENRPGVHNVIVCTLCSCYPTWLLGPSPSWYKDAAYRSRVVREPRAVLAEMGLVLDPEAEIQVWDSSAELRYMVLPERPDGTEDMSEEGLAALVTRESLIGVARANDP